MFCSIGYLLSDVFWILLFESKPMELQAFEIVYHVDSFLSSKTNYDKSLK